GRGKNGTSGGKRSTGWVQSRAMADAAGANGQPWRRLRRAAAAAGGGPAPDPAPAAHGATVQPAKAARDCAMDQTGGAAEAPGFRGDAVRASAPVSVQQ